MEECSGNGSCLEQCGCGCYDDNDNLLEVCICGHRDHTVMIGGDESYCRRLTCQYNCRLVPCYNFWYCRRSLPQWVLWCDKGMCQECAMLLGKMTLLNEKDECPICMETKDMIQIDCGLHSLCLDCWLKMSETKEEDSGPLKCPMCRKGIWS